jgi:hypothetical protein
VSPVSRSAVAAVAIVMVSSNVFLSFDCGRSA